MVGREGIKERADFLAMAVKFGLTLHDLAAMENVYSPAIGALNEPIVVAAQNGVDASQGRLTMSFSRWLRSNAEHYLLVARPGPGRAGSTARAGRVARTGRVSSSGCGSSRPRLRGRCPGGCGTSHAPSDARQPPTGSGLVDPPPQRGAGGVPTVPPQLSSTHERT